MINTQLNTTRTQGQIILSPNKSACWKNTKLFLYIVCSVALLIGLAFASLGLWIILPFSGIEIIVLIIVMYRVSRNCYRQEVIHLDEQGIRVEQGRHTPVRIWQSDLFWTRLVVKPAVHPGHPRRVVLRGRHDHIEIGTFLNEADKETLIRQLQTAIVAI